MSIYKKKEKVKLNEVLNNRLDSLEDNSALDVFTPKKDMNYNMMAMVNDAMDIEMGKKKRKNGSSGKDMPVSNTGIILICFLFIFFVCLMYMLIF